MRIGTSCCRPGLFGRGGSGVVVVVEEGVEEEGGGGGVKYDTLLVYVCEDVQTFQERHQKSV